jgi:hypothetical protein
MKQHLTGGCLCQKIRFTISGKSLGSGQCYCPDCRKTCGGGPANAFVVSRDSLTIEVGVPKTYESTTHAGSRSTRAFCGDCGTPLFGSKSSSPGTVAVMVGALDDDADFRPQAISWASTAPEWMKLDDALPRFEKDIVNNQS